MNARALFREAAAIYAVAFVLVLVLAIGAAGVGFLAANLYALVAGVFLGLPYWWLGRKKLDPEDFGLTTSKWARSALWGLIFTAATVPVFLIGQYVWEAEIRERPFQFELEHYRRWPVELEGAPKTWGQEPGAWVYAVRHTLFFGLRGSSETPGRLLLTCDVPCRPRSKQGGVLLRPVNDKGEVIARRAESALRWEMQSTWAHRRVFAELPTISEVHGVGPRRITVETRSTAGDGKGPWPLRLGPGATLKSGPQDISRGLVWMLLWAITQVFFIALPEEYFYRGYLQTRLAQAFGARRQEQDPEAPAEERAWLGFTPSIFVASLLFGLGHLLIPVDGVLLGARFAVFFPSLLFGWIRRHTGSIVGGVLYHAACNLMVLYMVIHYG